MSVASSSCCTSPQQLNTTSNDSQDPQKGRQRLSCMECQKRKAKCDKETSCSTCTQRGIVCRPAASNPDRPRKKRFPEAELLARIRKYEAVLISAGLLNDQDTLHPGIDAKNGEATSISCRTSHKRTRLLLSDSESSSATHLRDQTDPSSNSVDLPPAPPRTSTIDPDIGIISSILDTVTPGKSEPYTPRHFEFGAHEACPAPAVGPSRSNQISTPASDNAILPTFVMHRHLDLMFPEDGAQRLSFDDHCPGEPLEHPDTSLMFRLLHIYQQSIHPLVKIVHLPTVRERLCDITTDPSITNNDDHALFFAIYMIAVGTLTPDEAERLFNAKDKRIVVAKYRRNAQTALCRVGIWRSSHVATLQAYLLYLLSVTKDTDPRTYAVFAGNGIRMAKRMLLFHRMIPISHLSSGSRVKIIQEMANRVWWEMLACDIRACEKSGIPTSPSLATATTQLPQNVPDTDFEQLGVSTDAEMVPNSSATRSQPWTAPDSDCLFLLLRCEIAQFQLHPLWSEHPPDYHLERQPFRETAFYQQYKESSKRLPASSLEPRLAAVTAFDCYISNRYFNRPEAASNTLIQYAHHHARIWLAKLRLLVLLSHRAAENEAETIRLCSVQIEETIKLVSNEKFVRFQWFTYSHLPFFAFIVLLDLLRRHTSGRLVDQTWDVVEKSAAIWRPGLLSKQQQTGARSSSATPSSSRGPASERETPNIHSDLDTTDENKVKLQIRGTMMAALMVAAWEKRAQTLMAESGPDFVAAEPAIVTAMREAAALHHIRPHALTSSPSPVHFSQQVSSLSQSMLEALDNQPFPQQGFSTGPHRNMLGTGMGEAYSAFFSPAAGTSNSGLDEIQHIQALLQSTVDLDWSSWLGQTWDSTIGSGTTAPAAQFGPSL